MTSDLRVCCLASQLTSKIVEFRNSDKLEERFFGVYNRRTFPNQIGATLLLAGKRCVAELGFGVLSVAAIVETIAYTLLGAGVNLLFFNDTNETSKWIFSLYNSSKFTIFWNINNLYFNLALSKTQTNESFARFEITRSFAFFDFLRPQDASYVIHTAPDYIRTEHTASRVIIQITTPEEHKRHPTICHAIEEGTDFFIEYILKNERIKSDARELILELDPSTFHFTLTRAGYIYAFGEKRNEKIPDFFEIETKESLERMRRDYTQEDGVSLATTMQSLSLFEEEPENPKTKEILCELKQSVYREMQGLLVTQCWKKACESIHSVKTPSKQGLESVDEF